jgi:plasmid replication initiation protein
MAISLIPLKTKKNIIDSHNLITNERLVYKDNALIMSSYTVTVYEQRLLIACIEKAQRKVDPLNSDAVEISLTVQEYADQFNVPMKTAYKALSESSAKLYERSIRIDDAGVKRNVRWLQEQAVYESGKVKLVFSNVISRHISEFVTGTTAYRLEQATQLRNQHAIRFFEIFQMVIGPNKDQGDWVVTIDYLKELLELGDKYERWIDFKRKVIEESLRQINKNTSLRVDYEVAEKAGKQITAIRFNVFESSQLSLSLSD